MNPSLKKALIATACIIVALAVGICVFMFIGGSGGGTTAEINGGGTPAQIEAPEGNDDSVETEGGEDAPSDSDDEQPAAEEKTPEQAEAERLAEKLRANSTNGETVLDPETDVLADADLTAAATADLAEGVEALRGLESTSEETAEQREVYSRYFYTSGNTYNLYAAVVGGSGTLDESSVRVYSNESLDDGVYKISFQTLDNSGNPTYIFDGYYTSLTGLIKVSDFAVATEAE